MEDFFTQNTCRTCYNSKDVNELVSLFEIDQIEGKTFKDMLYDVVSIEILANDDLPSVICRECSNILTIAHKFKQECKLSNEKFRMALEMRTKLTLNTNIDVDSLHISDDLIENDTVDHTVDGTVDAAMICFNDNGIKTKVENDKVKNNQIKNNQLNNNKIKNDELRIINDKKSSKNKGAEKNNTCSYCEKTFRSTYDLTVHVRRHTGIKPYVCKVCNVGFVSMGRLTSHSRMHTGETPFACKTCDKVFSHSSTLYKHAQSHKKAHVCESCGKRFTFASYLETHKLTHSDTRPYRCDICGKGFVDEKLLRRHRIVHQDERPHLCNVCGKSFKRKTTLKKHLRTQHKKEKQIMNGTFSDPRQLCMNFRKGNEPQHSQNLTQQTTA